MLTVPMRTVVGEDDEDHRAGEIHEDRDAAPVLAIDDDAGHRAEDQRRQVLAQERQRHEERIAGERGDQQRTCRHDDAVAQVHHDDGSEQRPERPAEARWRDRVDECRHGRGHVGMGASA